MKKINVNTVKNNNRFLILEQILNNEITTRTEIAYNLQISNATVGNIVDELISSSIIKEEKDMTSSIGRKPSLLKLDETSKYILIFDISSKEFSYTLLNLNLTIVDSESYDYNKSVSFENNLRSFLSHTQSRFAMDVTNKIIGIGISIPGTYIVNDDKVICRILPELQSIKLDKILNEYFDNKIYVENDMKFLSVEDVRNVDDYLNKQVFFMCLSSGIGGSFMSKGKIYKGLNGSSSEIGQTIIGANNTLENLVDWSGFVKKIHTDYPNTDIKGLLSNNENKSVKLTKIIDDLTSYIAQALTNIIWLLSPNTIIISEQYDILGDKFIWDLKQKIKEYMKSEIADGLEIILIPNKQKSVILGAARHIRQKWTTEYSKIKRLIHPIK